jgi:hypothetical protein
MTAPITPPTGPNFVAGVTSDVSDLRWKLIKLGLIIVAVLGIAAAIYFTAKAQGAAAERARITDSVRTILADSSRAIEARLAARAPIIQQTLQAATVAHVAHAAAATAFAKHVVVLTDSTVSVDSGPPVKEVPASLVVPEIRTCDHAVAADTIAYRAVVAQLADVTADRDTWKKRAELDEANTPKIPRFGLGTGLIGGFIAGVGLVVSIIALVR